jgi:hypothetical protein
MLPYRIPSYLNQGTAANLGMYASGIPMGIITDRKSPRLAAIIGMFALLVGYYPIKLGTLASVAVEDRTDCVKHTIKVLEA